MNKSDEAVVSVDMRALEDALYDNLSILVSERELSQTEGPFIARRINKMIALWIDSGVFPKIEAKKVEERLSKHTTMDIGR